jgi:hypothetical protein
MRSQGLTRRPSQGLSYLEELNYYVSERKVRKNRMELQEKSERSNPLLVACRNGRGMRCGYYCPVGEQGEGRARAAAEHELTSPPKS